VLKRSRLHADSVQALQVLNRMRAFLGHNGAAYILADHWCKAKNSLLDTAPFLDIGNMIQSWVAGWQTVIRFIDGASWGIIMYDSEPVR
jgi:hypothetical protein